MANFEIKGYDSYSGCDIVVTARLSALNDSNKKLEEKVYTLGSLQTLSVSTHQDKKPVRVIGSMNALDYTMGQRTIAGSLVFAVFDQHFATEMFNDLQKATGKTFFLPDELPAMDITITFANEYGRTSRMAIYGLRIINEGQVMSINDLYTENTYQFVANAMQPLAKGTKTGSSSDKNNQTSIASVFDDLSNPITFSGEDIWNQGGVQDNEDLKRVLLIVDTEQPIYEGQDGIAKFSLSPNQSSGIIYILNQLKDKVIQEIHIENNTVYSVYLESGTYSAWYEDKGQTLSNTVLFNIASIGEYNTVIDDTPIIDNVSENSISITSNNPTHTYGVAICSEDNSTHTIDLKSRSCKFTGLKSNTKYLIYTKDDYSISNIALTKTLNKDENYTEGFKNYVKFNSILLSSDLEQYDDILNTLTEDKDIINVLEKNKDIKSKELMYMAVKYRNEFTAIINNDKYKTMPSKNLDNICGNSIKFETGAVKANIFILKNTKEYFEHCEIYPSEFTYLGKTNKAYNVVAVNNDFVKSPKYLFFSYSDNDKSKLESLYGHSNVLNNIDLSPYINPSKRYSDIILKCLAIKDNKNIDIKLLKAPVLNIDEFNNLIADISYIDSLGGKDKTYYLCISDLEQSLDKTPFRKIKITDRNKELIASNYLTAINTDKAYAVWIEDNNLNVVSDIAFISNIEDIENFNLEIIQEEFYKLVNKIEFNLGRQNSINDIQATVLNKCTGVKNLHYDIIQSLIDLKISNRFNIINELLKIKFNDYYINQDKYRKAIYDFNRNEIKFDNSTGAQIIHIAFKQDTGYSINVINENSINIDLNNDYNVYYLIDNNPVIKSGYILIDSNKKIVSHSIRLEEI